MSEISIIMPCYNQSNHTINALSGLVKTCNVDYETILVDDGSKEPIYKILPKLYPSIKVIRNDINSGFVKSVNRGIKEAVGDLVLLLNNDVDVGQNPMWLKKMFDSANKRGLDMCAPAGGNLDGKYNYIPGESKKENDKFTYLPFWCCLINRKVIDVVGLLDERFGMGFWDDADYCHRVKKSGFKMGIVELPEVKHAYHQTFLKSGINIRKQYELNRKIFLDKWGLLK